MKPEFFTNNRRKLRQRVGPGLIIINANGLMQRTGDTTFPFRQDNNFWYLTGVSEPDITLVMDDDKEYLILPPRDEISNIFNGYINTEVIKKVSGINSVLSEAKGWPQLNAKLKQLKEVAILEPLDPFVRFYDFYSNPARRQLKERLARTNPKLLTRDIREDLAALRVIKDKQEIQQIQKAIDITVSAIKAVVRKLPKLEHEREVEALLSYEYRSRGADGDSFQAVVASGRNASTIHYFANSGKLQKNQLLLIDTGAEYNNYAADISRTLWLSKPTRRQTAIIEAVQRAQQHAISLIRPGVNFYDYEMAMEKYMGKELKQLGLIKAAHKKAIRKYFPHATSHFLGLDVHDVGDRWQDFQENMVLAVEPGIVIPEEGIGVRIEDNVLVTKTGCEVLSKNLPALLS